MALPEPGNNRLVRDLDLTQALVFWSFRDLFGEARDDEAIADSLGSVPLEVALVFLGRVSCLLERRAAVTLEGQVHLLRRLGLPDPTVRQLADQMAEGTFRPIFSAQQIPAAIRYALETCVDRPATRAEHPGPSLELLKMMVASADPADPDIELGDEDGLRSYLLRQSGVHSRVVMVYAAARQVSLLTTEWRAVHGAEGFENLEGEFRARVGMTISEHIQAAVFIWAAFNGYAESVDEPPFVARDAEQYLVDAGLSRQVADAFVKRYSATPSELRTLVSEETAKYGSTRYRISSLDRKPLLRLPDGRVLPASFGALERLSWEGAYWLCRPPEQEKRFGGLYGRVVEKYVLDSALRCVQGDSEVTDASGDFDYGPRRRRVRSSDVNIRYPRDWLAFEVVSGRPTISTLTRGGIRAYREDLDRLVVNKAIQLARCQRDAAFGTLQFGGRKLRSGELYWPILILADGFPVLGPLYGDTQDHVAGRVNWTQGHPTLTLLTGDDVSTLERLAESGYPLLWVLRTWKRELPRQPLSDWLRGRSEFAGGVGVASEPLRAYRELTDGWIEALKKASGGAK